MRNKTYILEGLSCSSCAEQIGDEIREAQGVADADLDLSSKLLKLRLKEGADLREMTKRVKEVVGRIEPGVKVREEGPEGHDHKENHGNFRGEIIRLAAGAALFAIALFFGEKPVAGLALFLASYIILGYKVFCRAVKGIFAGNIFTEYFLMSIATAGAFIIGEYPEGAAVMLFYLTGELLQETAVAKSRRSITSLLEIKPERANVLRGGKTESVRPEEVEIGEIIFVKPGERIPLDGVVTEGSSSADVSALTGESLPRMLEEGSEALSGFINKDGALRIKVSRKYADSTVARILELVKSSGKRKAGAERFIAKFAKYYTPAVVFAALALAFIPPLAIQGASFAEWGYRALVFLVISCPCALVISIPLGFFGGIGGASRKGILVKGANYLDALSGAWAVVFDKTGTLTEGRFKVTKAVPGQGFSEDKLLEYAAHAESLSNHPIALSVAGAYKGEIDRARVSGYREISGQGISAEIDGKPVLLGNSRLMSNNGIEHTEAEEGGTVLHAAVGGGYAGYILVEDAEKADAAAAIAALKKLDVKKTVMLSGDVKAAAQRIAEKIGIDEARWELLPEDKVREIERLEGEKPAGGKIIYVGDGINDAPVIARADVGAAMGGLGSAAAIEAADMVIMTDEPKKVATAIRIARKTKRIVLENILMAVSVKLAVLILGALGIASMWLAVFADIGVSLLAILNSLRSLNIKE